MPADHTQKSLFLQELASLQPINHTPWLVLGDFNLLRAPHEKMNSSFRQNEANLFNATLNTFALIELPLLIDVSPGVAKETIQRSKN